MFKPHKVYIPSNFDLIKIVVYVDVGDITTHRTRIEGHLTVTKTDLKKSLTSRLKMKILDILLPWLMVLPVKLMWT